MKIVFVFLMLLGSGLASAQTQPTGKCIVLENISIGCVPSTIHPCFLNRSVNGRGTCKYVGDFATQFKADTGPVNFNCATTPETIETCVITSEGRTCTTTQKCNEWMAPTCREICEGCWKVIREPLVGRAAGCIVCTRPYCDDEPPVNPAAICPEKNEDLYWEQMYTGGFQGCGGNALCPTKAIDPSGKEHAVIISRSPCPKPPELVEYRPPNPKYCPWISDKRTAQCPASKPDCEVNEMINNCEPIAPDNRYVPEPF